MVDRHTNPRKPIWLPPRATQKFETFKDLLSRTMPYAIEPQNVQIIEKALDIAIAQVAQEQAIAAGTRKSTQVRVRQQSAYRMPAGSAGVAAEGQSDGPARIRTEDIRRVKATLYR